MPPSATTTHSDRLTRLRAHVASAGVDGVVLTKATNRQYVTGFAGSAGIAIVSAVGASLIADFRYVEQATAQAPEFTVVRATGPLIEAAGAVVKEMGLRRIGVEADAMPVGTYRKLATAVAPAEVVPLDGIDRVRWIKSADEVDSLRKAMRISDESFAAVLPMIHAGVREHEIAVALEDQLRRRGAQKIAFDTIVASGPRSALPHGVATDRVIGRGEFVTVDYGGIVDGYCSDCTRTVVTAPASDRHHELYMLVLRAQRAALDGLRPGITGREGDRLARDVIVAAGHGDAFGHGLGHGLGLAVHEGPTLSPREDAVLPAGSVVTVEPGVYLAGWGGVRIEDVVVLTDTGCQNLTGLAKTLIEVSA
jgi:Xaa-Pro aminopeptidase